MSRALFLGLLAGLVLALLLDIQLPISRTPKEEGKGSTLDVGFADMLRNSLLIARQVVRGVGRPGLLYKGVRLPTWITPQTTTPNPNFHSTSPYSTMSSVTPFIDAIKARRSIYALDKTSPISEKEIQDIVKDIVLHVPSSFNSQSARLVLLLNEEHDRFWDFTLEILKTMVPAEQLPSTEGRIAGFKGGKGTVLFFEDPEPVQALEKAFPIYAHHFPTWSEHTSAMHQYALWVALEAAGLGANLQHYNPIVDRKVQEYWNVPLEWKLRAQLVFGGKTGEPGPKEFKPVEQRLFVHGAKE